MPDAVRFRHLSPFVDEHRQSVLLCLHVTDNVRPLLSQDDGHASAARGVRYGVVFKLAEPAAAVGSPRAAIENEQKIVGRNFVLVGRNFVLVGRNFSSGTRQQLRKTVRYAMRVG